MAYLTLGDPTIYSTYIYIHQIVRKQGFPARIINGVPSFCAAAAALDCSLAERSQQLHIIPSSYGMEAALDYPGNKLLMKAASRLPDVKRTLLEKNLKGMAVENCGMPGEHIYPDTEQIPGQAGYYTVILVKEETHD